MTIPAEDPSRLYRKPLKLARGSQSLVELQLSHSRRETQASCIGKNIAYTLGDSESTHDLLSIATLSEIYVIRDPAWLFVREQQTMRDLSNGALTSDSRDKSLLGVPDKYC